MKYHVEWSLRVQKQMRKLDRAIAGLLLRWVHKNLDGCENPRQHGKALTANLAGQWRYRVGDYRLLAEIREQEIVILILSVGHRKEVYS